MKTSVLKFVSILSILSMMSPVRAHNHNDQTPQPALRKNVCDRLINPSDEELNWCFEDHGRSPWRINEDETRVALDQARRDLDNTEARERGLLELQVFSRSDLDRHFYNHQVIAVKAMMNRDEFEYTQVFDLNRVCTSLGFAQEVEFTIGSMWTEIDAREAGNEHNRGIVISELGNRTAFRKSLFPRNYYVRPLEAITCARTRDGSTLPLRHLPPIELMIDETIGRPVVTSRSVNDGSRTRTDIEPRYNDFTSGAATGSLSSERY